MSENPGTDPEIQALFGPTRLKFIKRRPRQRVADTGLCRAMGDENPVYRDAVCPEVTGIRMCLTARDDVFVQMPDCLLSLSMVWLLTLRGRLAEHGFNSVLAVNYGRNSSPPCGWETG